MFSKNNEPSVERSEVIAIAEIGRKEGVFSETESRILKNLISMRSVFVSDIMTPRIIMTVAKEDMSLTEFVKDARFKLFSRIPLSKGSKDRITGFIHKHDILEYLNSNESERTLKEFKREIPMVSEDQNIYKLYSFLTQEKAQIALVVEEYGGTAGLVTMEDVLETLLGLEIVDEFDKTDDLQEYARSQWKKRAERLGLISVVPENPPEEETEETSND